MCGSFGSSSLSQDIETVTVRLDVPPVPFEWIPRYNIAPTQDAFVIVDEDNRHSLQLMKWGITPK